jgi:hypothetical protein
MSMPEDFAEGDTSEVFMNLYNNENMGEFPANADNSSQRRLRMTEYFKNQGWRRPTHANCNSKAFT